MSADPVMSDIERERLIDSAFSRMIRADWEADRLKNWEEMVQLVRQRSADQIKRMEYDRRLRR